MVRSLKKPLSEGRYGRNGIDEGKRRMPKSELTFTLASRSVGEPALPSCTFMSAADEPLPLLDVGDVRLFSHEFEDEFLQTPPPAPAIELSPVSDLFYEQKGSQLLFKLQPTCNSFFLSLRLVPETNIFYATYLFYTHLRANNSSLANNNLANY